MKNVEIASQKKPSRKVLLEKKRLLALKQTGTVMK